MQGNPANSFPPTAIAEKYGSDATPKAISNQMSRLRNSGNWVGRGKEEANDDNSDGGVSSGGGATTTTTPRKKTTSSTPRKRAPKKESAAAVKKRLAASVAADEMGQDDDGDVKEELVVTTPKGKLNKTAGGRVTKKGAAGKGKKKVSEERVVESGDEMEEENAEGRYANDGAMGGDLMLAGQEDEGMEEVDEYVDDNGHVAVKAEEGFEGGVEDPFVDAEGEQYGEYEDAQEEEQVEQQLNGDHGQFAQQKHLQGAVAGQMVN